MAAYTVYIISRVRAVAYYILFYFAGFVSSCILFVSTIEDDDILGFSLLLSWLLLFWLCFYLARWAASTRYAASIKNGHLQLIYTASRRLHFGKSDLLHHKIFYSGLRPRAIVFHLQNGRQLRLNGRILPGRSLGEFPAFVDDVTDVANNGISASTVIRPISEASEDTEVLPLLPVETQNKDAEAIHCKALKVYSWLWVGIMFSTVNALFVLLLLVAFTEDMDTLTLILVSPLALLEIVAVYWFFIILFRRKADVLVYRDRVVIRELKKYTIQTERTHEFYFKDISEFKITAYNTANAHIKLVDQRNRKYTFQEYFPANFTKDSTGNYVLSSLSSAFRDFTANYKTGVKIKVTNSWDIGGLTLIADILAMFS